jgi:hydrogenase maturation protease
MNLAAVDQVAHALLYEGYLLYPYRASSIKNQQRFNFGVLYPRAYSEAQDGADRWWAQTECLIADSGDGSVTADVRIRFLQMTGDGDSQAQQAIEREIRLPPQVLTGLAVETFVHDEEIAGVGNPTDGQKMIGGPAAGLPGTAIRPSGMIQAKVEVFARCVSAALWKLKVRVRNTGSSPPPPITSRDEVMARSLVSAHIVLGVEEGEFVSLLDPPESLRTAAESCENQGVYPVLVGDRTRKDTMLCSPIILYDFPEIAPESAGDLFDATEIDEILSLRILTLTDDEKNEIRAGDERARRILERTETLPFEQLQKLHGTVRGMRPVEGRTE